MDADQIAEAFERARYEQLRGHLWDDLRESERETRIGVARTALETSGVAAVVADLRRRADRAGALEQDVAARDGRVAELELMLAELRAELAETRTLLSAAEHRADAAVEVVAAARASLEVDTRDLAPVVAPVVASAPVASAVGGHPAEAPTPHRGLFHRGRLARS